MIMEEEKKEIENAHVEAVEAEPVKTDPKKAETAELERAETKKEESETAESEKIETKKPESETAEPKTAETTESKTEEAKSESTDTITEKPVKKRHGKVICAAVLVSLIVLLAAAYMGIGSYYQTHFLPNTIVNDIDVSGMEAAEAAELLDAWVQNYVLEITGRDPATAESGTILGTITPDAVGLTYAGSEATLVHILEQQDWLMWIKSYLQQEQQEIFVERGTADIDEELLETLVKSWDAFLPSNMIAAGDAYIGEYDPEHRAYEIIPETRGTELDVEKAIPLMNEKLLYMLSATLDLEEAELYAEPHICQDDSSLTVPVETANLWLSTNIVYDWNGNEVVLDAETIQDWVTIENGKAVLDEEAVSSFVKAQSRKYDTYGKYKEFTTTHGVTLKLASPSYGWRTDTAAEIEELVTLIREGSTGAREPIYTHQGMIKVADSVNDIGDSYVEADLTNQHLYLYQDGEIVLETDFVSGKISNGNGTPAGIFGITYKTTNAVLRGQDYATPVNYWMPFYGNYGMHDATWRASFGGSIYLNNGSHGCINLPKAMAEQIYGYVYAGFPVICYYYETPVAPEGGEELPDPEMEAQVVPAEGEQPAPEQ